MATKFTPLPELYRDEVIPALMKEFDYSSVMQVPRITKVVVNIGLGEALDNAKAIEFATNDITLITGQKPVLTKAKKSIAGFKLRDGRVIGLKVTLRGEGDNGSFVEVHRGSATGPQVWAGLLKAGGTKTFPTTTRLWVRTYNAPGLSVTVKGKTRRFTGSVAAFTVDQNGAVPDAKAGN